MTMPNIEQLLSQLEQQSETLNKEIQTRKRAEFLTHQHINTLEAKNKELNLLANIAVHNLAKPIQGIEQNLARLKNKKPLQDQAILQDFINHLENNLADIQGLLTYYRDYTSPKSTSKDFQPLSMQFLLEQAIQGQEELIKTHTASILYEPAAFKACPPIMGNEEQLVAVIQQLVSNAIQYRSEKPIQIEFKLESQKEFCLLSIQDNGRGIESKYFEQIFWFIKPDELSGEYKKTSIGLAICKKVIEHHQGKMWLSSIPKQGTTFYIMLPLAHAT